MTSVFAKSRRATAKKLDSCRLQQEAWVEDHQKAMLVFDVDDLLGDMLEIYSVISKLDATFRNEVIDNPELYDAKFDGQLKQLCCSYLALSEEIANTTLKWVCDYEIENQAAFLEHLRMAQESSKHDFESDAQKSYDELLPEISELEDLFTPIEQWPN